MPSGRRTPGNVENAHSLESLLGHEREKEREREGKSGETLEPFMVNRGWCCTVASLSIMLANSRIETGFLLLSFLSREKEFLEYISKHECLKFWTIIFSRIEELDKKKKISFSFFPY